MIAKTNLKNLTSANHNNTIFLTKNFGMIAFECSKRFGKNKNQTKALKSIFRVRTIGRTTREENYVLGRSRGCNVNRITSFC